MRQKMEQNSFVTDSSWSSCAYSNNHLDYQLYDYDDNAAIGGGGQGYDPKLFEIVQTNVTMEAAVGNEEFVENQLNDDFEAPPRFAANVRERKRMCSINRAFEVRVDNEGDCGVKYDRK